MLAVFALLCFLFHIVFGSKENRETNILCGVATWISLCSLHPGCSPAASQGANTAVPPQQRFHPAQHTWHYSEDLGSQEGESFSSPPATLQQAQGSSFCAAAVPSPKPKDDGDTRSQVLRCKSCSCSQQRAGLICAMGASKMSDCRVMVTMLPEPVSSRSLPFGLSSISGSSRDPRF